MDGKLFETTTGAGGQEIHRAAQDAPGAASGGQGGGRRPPGPVDPPEPDDEATDPAKPPQNFRNADPFTSKLSGMDHERTGVASRQRQACLRAVEDGPGRTAQEIEQAIGIRAHKRLPELREMLLVHNGPARECRVSKRLAMTWLPGPERKVTNG